MQKLLYKKHDNSYYDISQSTSDQILALSVLFLANVNINMENLRETEVSSIILLQ